MHFERVYIHRKSTLHVFVSDLKCSSTLRDIAAGFWNRENLKNVPHWISGPWSITGTPWIIHRVMIRSCLRLGDISDIMQPSFLQLRLRASQLFGPGSVPPNGRLWARLSLLWWDMFNSCQADVRRDVRQMSAEMSEICHADVTEVPVMSDIFQADVRPMTVLWLTF